MQLNQYAKVARAADLVDEAERVLRSALPAPADDEQAVSALREVLELTRRLADEADRLGLGKPAPGRVPARRQLLLGGAEPRAVADVLSGEQGDS